MLAAEYQATVLAGWEMSQKYPGRAGSGRLVLTGIGGGVFANPWEIIIGAVASAKDLIRQSGLQVYFVCFDRRTFDGAMSAGLKQIMEELGGKIVTVKGEL
jgi:O-acetyl-ADP-ribose deacetylase (regulator of RNase III)